MRYHPKVNEFAIIITKGPDDSQGLIEKGFNSPPWLKLLLDSLQPTMMLKTTLDGVQP